MYGPIFDGVRRFFGSAIWEGAPVVTVFASPDRAVEEVKRILKRRGAGNERQQSDRPVPVPFMSVWIPPLRYRPDGFSPATITVAKDVRTGTALVARAPHPVTSDIQVDLWCGSAGGHSMAQSIEPQIDLRFFGGCLSIPVNWGDARWYKPPFDVFEHARYFGQSRVILHLEPGWTDTSDIESGEGAKEVRRTWQGRLEALVPFRPESARLIAKIEADLIDIVNDEVLGEPVEVE